ncbi:MAG: GNAT family N-acetyltransferase [Mediterranea sp.]|jgi:GNAT superfamily N-acetyltransferase|nr:GNAT family N-acetyltransferase [Mediterranea sp.]
MKQTHIAQITNNKKQYLDLLLLADEQESMIDHYLERGDMFVLYHHDSPVSSIVVTDEGEGVYEIKSIATYPEHQRKGYAQHLIKYVETYYQDIAHTWLVGTGDTPQIIGFYEHCGFTYSHRIPNFFVDNYDHPIIEDGRQLTDMVYLKKDNSPKNATFAAYL